MLLDENPRRAVINISKPIILATFVESIYSIVDTIWVSKLGTLALSAIGASFPLLILLYAISWGLGIGVSSAISRRIGAKREEEIKEVIGTSVVLGLLFSILLFIVSLFLSDIYSLMGIYGEVKKLSISYIAPILKFSIIFIFFDIVLGILRGMGESKKVMKVSVIGSFLNIILDPIFIYTLNLGIAGAAYATLISLIIGALSVKSSVKLHLRFNFKIAKDLLRVSLPTTFIDLSTAVIFFFLTSLVSKVSGNYGLAIYTASLRVTDLGFIPIIGLASGATSVIGAYYGAKDIKRLKEAYFFSIKLGLAMEALIVVLLIILSPYLALLFTFENSNIYKDLVFYIKIASLYLLFMPPFFISTSLYQGIGEGEKAFFLSLLRNFLRVIFPYLLAINLFFIFIGLILGELVSSLISFILSLLALKFIEKRVL
ncbi:MATE efflux family protein [Methanocaldococcus infernus ME]|uniref:MATE efflux family protein n=1 Tax=Methanocaldococcus infernus (strain DSM 11812 / JCM 15783 / ME) TaxID=573063 RepID=D5VSG5_METIM|nr:MATE family efflux transporter [Methanocaldococcus infernus]ADG13518.1 MATE efflux family protein [Methanocaldococcus infernus ME]